MRRISSEHERLKLLGEVRQTLHPERIPDAKANARCRRDRRHDRSRPRQQDAEPREWTPARRRQTTTWEQQRQEHDETQTRNPNPRVDPGRGLSSRERPWRCQQRVGGILAGEMGHPPR